MDKKKAMAAFRDYAGQFDETDVKISLKIRHTYRVAEIAERIAESLELDGREISLAWFLGLLHDIGRFEQLAKYDTFKDEESIDHAELGADILFHGGTTNLLASGRFVGGAADVSVEGVAGFSAGVTRNKLIDRFPTAGLPDDWESVAETAIRLHNKLALPDGLDEREERFCHILRDADKCDIFRVLTEPPYDARNERIIVSNAPARAEVMACVREHRCVPKTFERTDFESLISQCCMAFELSYPESRRIVAEQGYLEQLMRLAVRDEEMKAQMDVLRSEMGRVL